MTSSTAFASGCTLDAAIETAIEPPRGNIKRTYSLAD
jgi:hypothetical protein